LREVVRVEPDNVLVSPLSVSMALGMTLNGAGGGTWEEMRATLGFAGLSAEEINDGYRQLLNQVRLRDPSVTLGVANSVWHDAGFALEPQFIEQAQTYFDAEVGALDFGSASAPGVINDWVSAATGGRIPRLIESISADEVAFLVNAVYFKAAWSSPFDPRDTRAGVFRRDDGGASAPQFMRRDGAVAANLVGDVVAVELPYADSAFTMVLVMPASGTVNDYVATLTAEQLDALLTQLAPTNIVLRVPKFTFEMKAELKAALAAMGMPSAFDDRRADFTPMSPVRDDLFLSRVQHDTYIKVDEVGTEAAAATAVGVGVTSAPPELAFDHPFLVVIRERDTGTILFLGVVRDPAS
jgi:serpin B